MRFLFLFLLGSACFGQNIEPRFASSQLHYRYIQPKDFSYEEVIQNTRDKRNSLKSNKANVSEIRRYFLRQFEFQIFPHWVGTPWDYNGYTNRPGEDKLIACGYFVSTPLKHMGFNWNRFKLAQMYSKNIAETLCSDVTKYADKESMLDEINSRDNHLYIVGLDSHVGMLLKSTTGTWFVHSNYYGLIGPDKEVASLSDALDVSSNYYLGTFSSDENMKKWIDGTEFITE